MFKQQTWLQKRTTLICFGLSLFLFGLTMAKLIHDTYWFTLVLISIILAGIILLKKHKQKMLVVTLFVAMFTLGFIRGHTFNNQLVKYNDLFGRNIIVQAKAREDSVYSEKRQIIFTATDIKIMSANDLALPGNIQIEGFGANMVYRGDTVIASGKLFSKRGDNIAGLSYAPITVTKQGGSKIDKIRREFIAGVQNTLPEPLASLGVGLLIGQRNTLPKDFNEQLVSAGLIHIVAVSGYNLTILVGMSQKLLQKRSRYQAVVGSLLLVTVFLLLTGSSPSIVRASMVSFISLLMWFFGRNIKPIMILLLVAVITAGYNPLYLWRSIGWYLSFTAFFGVLILAPLIRQRFIKFKQRGGVLTQTLTDTISAQICTLPIILLFFGRLSLISIVANVLVVPMIPFAMIFTLISGIYGMVGPIFLGGLFVLPARILLWYIVIIADLFSSIRGGNLNISISKWQMIILYGLLILLSIFIGKSRRSLTSK
jgi:competence protein ComEC